MPLLLPAIVANTPRPHQPLVLLQSSVSQSCLPILRSILQTDNENGQTLLICLLYPPSSLVGDESRPTLQVIDRTDSVPGFDEPWADPRAQIIGTIENAAPGPVNVVIDSADTLCADLESHSQAYTFIASLLELVRARPNPSRLILHAVSPTPLLPLLLSPRLSPSLTHIIAHPPALLKHIKTAHLTSPPPATPPARFWRVFAPIASRAWEVERLVYGADGPGAGGEQGEAVLEVLVRGPGTGERGKRGVERVLEGWGAAGACELTGLQSLQNVWSRKAPEEAAAPDPTQNVSFNLHLTPEQQESRSQVPLPYAHGGKAEEATSSVPGAILYDPDSADDIDDDDPDEDLDI
ncbi:hypothetical protein DENSPDRAFT_857157 [Dentipellis sp. KUC8613]|nr:hypothetical protein DENSPDRAFT_857157 [Dentipellis sp. KUC8613]